MTTTTADITLQRILNNSNPNQLDRAFKKIKLGNLFASVKVTFAALAGAATHDITSQASLNGATISGLDRETSDLLPAIQHVKTLRVTAATTANSVGSYAISDAGGTVLTPTAGANVGLALLSDDGKSITFPSADVTAFVIEYLPRPDQNIVTTIWASGV